jgi:hypothetical protein
MLRYCLELQVKSIYVRLPAYLFFKDQLTVYISAERGNIPYFR